MDSYPSSAWLQWGHGDEAVEEVRPAETALRRLQWLQWGHGDEAVEELPTCNALTTAWVWLQWGHGDEAVEEDAEVEKLLDAFKLQWGHGDEAVEEDHRMSSLDAVRSRFNGATAMKPWKRARPPDHLEQRT